MYLLVDSGSDDDDSNEVIVMGTVPPDELITESPQVKQFKINNEPRATVDNVGRFIFRDPCKYRSCQLGKLTLTSIVCYCCKMIFSMKFI